MMGFWARAGMVCAVLGLSRGERIADTSISGARVGRELDAAVFKRMARPHQLFTDLQRTPSWGRG